MKIRTPVVIPGSRYPLNLSDMLPKRVGQCKICKIGDHEPKFLEYLYELRFDLTLPLSEIRDRANLWLTDLKDKTGRTYIHVNETNLHTHYKKHVPVELRTQYEMQVEFNKSRTSAQIARAHDASVERVERVQEDIDLFKHLMQIYDELNNEYEIVLDSPDENAGKRKLMLIDKRIKVLAELKRMKQSDKLIGIVIQALMTNYSENIMMAALTELENHKLELTNYIDDPAVRVELVEALKGRLGEAFSQGAVNSLKDIREKYPVLH